MSDKSNYAWAISKEAPVSAEQQIFLRLCGQSSMLLGEVFDNTIPLLDRLRDRSNNQAYILGGLMNACFLTSESIWLLIANGKYWDASAIHRSIVEGSIKLCFLCSGSDDEIQSKFNEFKNDLSLCNMIKRHERAEEVLKLIDSGSYFQQPRKMYSDLLLSQEEYERLKGKFSKSRRTQLSRKWSFHGMIEYLSNQNTPNAKFFRGFLYQFGMSSHSLHQDWDGVAMIRERHDRCEERQELINLAHGTSLLNDTIQLSFLRTQFLQMRLDAKADFIPHLAIKYSQLFEQFHALQNAYYKHEYGDKKSSDSG